MMDTKTDPFVVEIANLLRVGESRSAIVEQLLAVDISAEHSQFLIGVAQRYRVGQGDLGYGAWLHSILFGKAYRPAGSGLLTLSGIIAAIASISLAFWYVPLLPSGRYPQMLLALPLLLSTLLLTHLSGLVIFRYVVKSKANTTPSKATA